MPEASMNSRRQEEVDRAIRELVRPDQALMVILFLSVQWVVHALHGVEVNA